MTRLHFVGIGGSAMGSVAVASSQAGYQVTGSDHAIYPPMSDVLAASGITWYDGFHAERLAAIAPDLVIIGNAMSRGNPELEYVLDNRLPMTSMAAFVGSTLIDRSASIVVSGTHGKTTTTSMAAWILETAGKEPGFLIGGVPGTFSSGCRPVPQHRHHDGTGVFVVEGDEYDTAFFDKRSKFVHYRPTVAIVNNVEFDHADIFTDLDAILRSFDQLLRIVPSRGVVLANGDDVNVRRLIAGAYAPVATVGCDEADWLIRDVDLRPETSSWTLVHRGDEVGRFAVSLPGMHTVRNASMAIAATSFMGCSVGEQQRALASWRAPRRRMEERRPWHGRIVVDDFAHHPTAIAATMASAQQRYPERRIVAVFEPRSNTTTRAFFQHELATCFAGAAVAIIGPVNRPERYAEDQRLNTAQLQSDLGMSGIEAHVLPPERAADPGWGMDVIPILERTTSPGDVILLLSNGNVGNLRTLLDATSTDGSRA